MYVVKSAGGNRYWFDSCRQLICNLPSLTVLAVLNPGCHVCCHAFPGELAGYQAASRPNTRVGHFVHGGKNLLPVAGGHNRSGPPLRCHKGGARLQSFVERCEERLSVTIASSL
jgi:hypothetical protein